jgi:hypothetical protein
MHLEILVEDQSGKRALDILVPKIIASDHTFRVHPYKGIGRIPRNLRGVADPQSRILLDQLPRLLRGYGKTFAEYPDDCPAAVVVVCDLDDRCLKEFRGRLLAVLDACRPCPRTRFCIAIEEGEAWFLGDLAAVKSVYPSAKDPVLRSYVNDSICGTWETLADALYPGGASALLREGWHVVGAEKSKWAENIVPRMDVNANRSPSFRYFAEGLRTLVGDL